MKRATTPAWATLLATLSACGAHKAAPGDAGGAEAGPPLTTRRSFEVTATVITTSATRPVLTAPNVFTLMLDPTAGRAIAGGGGEAAAVGLTTDDNIAFHASKGFLVGLSQEPCAVQRLAYDRLDVAVAGDHLTGHAWGRALWDTPDMLAPVETPFEATLAGVLDTTPPTLVAPVGADIADPLAPYQLWTSEPLPDSALARLVGGDGAVAGLPPEIIDGDVPLIARFGRPTVGLPPGLAFEALYSDDVVDLAGNVAIMGESLRLGSVDAASLVPPDGFESATGQTVGGAALLRDGPGVPIAGKASAYVSQPGSPVANGAKPTPKLIARMAIPQGATKLVFSYRTLATSPTQQMPVVQVGSVSRAPGPETPLPAIPGTTRVMWDSQSVDESPVATMEVPLPDAVGPELVVVVRAPRASCKTGVTGVLIDDLRIE